jgi:hypothetical protein
MPLALANLRRRATRARLAAEGAQLLEAIRAAAASLHDPRPEDVLFGRAPYHGGSMVRRFPDPGPMPGPDVHIIKAALWASKGRLHRLARVFDQARRSGRDPVQAVLAADPGELEAERARFGAWEDACPRLAGLRAS